MEILITSVERHRSATLLELSRASCLVMTVVILGKKIVDKFVEDGRHCAFDVVHIGKDRALGPDGEEYIRRHGSKSSPSCACGAMISWSNERRGRIRPVTPAIVMTIAS